jgi:dTMP kinase
VTDQKRGLFLVFEGIDGSGKSTQARLLHETLLNKDIEATLTKEPTDGPFGRRLRQLAQKGRDEITLQEEYDLFMQDRAEHVDKELLPRLKQGAVIICDRYFYSTMAYQGALGLDPDAVYKENTRRFPIPDKVFYIAVSPAVGRGRISEGRNETPNLFEKKAYLQKVAAIFNAMPYKEIVRINGTQTIFNVQKKVWAVVEPLIK